MEQGVVVYHLVSITVPLRQWQCTVLTTLTTLLERQCMWDCMTVEVIKLFIILHSDMIIIIVNYRQHADIYYDFSYNYHYTCM